jgi:hypothetical protein
MSRQGSSPQKRQDALIALAARSPRGAPGLVTPVRTFLKGAALVLTAAPQVDATGTITPAVSGKIKVTLSGVLHNTDTSAAQHPCTVNVTATAASGTASESLDVFNGTPAAAAAGRTPFSFVVDLDQATTPHTFTVGEVVTVNVNLTGDASGDLSVVANGVVADVQEEWR